MKAIAKGKGHALDLVREGGEHSIYRVGDKQMSVPRHNEINEHTANGILRAVEQAEQAPKTDEEEGS